MLELVQELLLIKNFRPALANRYCGNLLFLKLQVGKCSLIFMLPNDLFMDSCLSLPKLIVLYYSISWVCYCGNGNKRNQRRKVSNFTSVGMTNI